MRMKSSTTFFNHVKSIITTTHYNPEVKKYDLWKVYLETVTKKKREKVKNIPLHKSVNNLISSSIGQRINI